MKKPIRWPLTAKEQKKYKGWVVVYLPDDHKKESGKIISLEKIDSRQRNPKKIGRLFLSCNPPCKKQPCEHKRENLVFRKV